MKKSHLILLASLAPFISFGQSYRNPSVTQPTKPVQVQVTQTPNMAQSIAAGAAARNARAASDLAATERIANATVTITIDELKATPDKYKNVAIKRVTGWAVSGNLKTLQNEIGNAKHYNLINPVERIPGKARIDRSKLFEPEIPSSFINNSETLFLEWSREALSGGNRLSRLVLKDSDNNVVYQAEYFNKGYTEMLKPVLSLYRYSKEEVKSKLLELKEYLELGIITQSEFDAKAEPLKKILIGN